MAIKIKIRRPQKTLAAKLLEGRKEKGYVIKDGYIHPSSWDNIPPAFDPSIPDDMTVVLPQLSGPSHKDLVDEAMSSFGAWFRSLSTDVRYGVERRLRDKLVRNLSLTELEEIMSRFTAAMKGWSSPERRNKKPK